MDAYLISDLACCIYRVKGNWELNHSLIEEAYIQEMPAGTRIYKKPFMSWFEKGLLLLLDVKQKKLNWTIKYTVSIVLFKLLKIMFLCCLML